MRSPLFRHSSSPATSAAVLPLAAALALGPAAVPTAAAADASPQVESRVKDIIEVDGDQYRDLNGNGELDPYEDWTLPVAERVEDLLDRMTLEEQAGLMLIDTLNADCTDGERGTVPEAGDALVGDQHMRRFVFRNTVTGPGEAECGDPDEGFEASTNITPEEAAGFTNSVQEMSEDSRLGIPSLFKSNARNHIDPDARAGINESVGAFTAFPKEAGISAAALGAEAAETGAAPTSGNMAVVEDFAQVMGQEWEAVGVRGMYGYMADLSTEPRWYRTHETFTENAEHASAVMETLVGTLQGPAEDGVALSPETSVALTLKHFPGAGPQEMGLDPHYAFGKPQVYPSDAFEEHLMPFEAAVDAGVASVMPYYGVPVEATRDGEEDEEYEEVGFAFSDQVIDGLLREDLGFEGYVNSDTGIIDQRAWGLEDLSVPERVAASINAGTDTLSGFDDVQVVLDLVDDGLVTPDRVEQAAERLLTPVFRMGLFENPYVDQGAASEILGSEEHQEVGRDVQRDSLVLLQNEESGGDPALPLEDGSDLYLLGDFDEQEIASHGYGVTDGNADEDGERPSAADSDHVIISLTARNEASDYLSDEEDLGLNEEHVNPSVLEGVEGLDGSSPYGAADACVAAGEEECTDDGLGFGGAYPWEASTLDFTGMQAADSWEVEPSLEEVQQVMDEVDDPGKVVLHVYFRQPFVLDEDSGLRDAGAIVAGFGASDTALMDVLSGEHPPQGRMPFALPATPEAVLEQDSDAPGYDESADGALYDYGFGLAYERGFPAAGWALIGAAGLALAAGALWLRRGREQAADA